MVDPTVIDEEINEDTNWRSVDSPSGFIYYFGSYDNWAMYTGSRFVANEWGSMQYPTQGKSHITTLYADTSASDPSSIENHLGIASSSGWEGVESLPSSYSATGHTVSATGSANENIAEYRQNATATKLEEGNNHFLGASVTISQTEGPSVSFNTTSPTTKNGRPNVLHTKGWLGPHAGDEFEIDASDPGTGVSRGTFSAPGATWEFNRLLVEGEHAGVQTEEQFSEGVKDSKSEISSGEDTVEEKVWDAVGLSATASAKVKVDSTPPYNLTFTGLPASGAIDEEQYHLKGEATDGKAPTPSSGIKSIDLFLDEREVAGKSGSCTLGPCTASGEWTLNVEGVGAGKHTLTLQATDNAGNVETKTYSITVRHASSLGVGPGSVDPITGAFHLGSSDVSIGGGQGSLGVSRDYDSRQLTAGEDGPLGPQWSLNIGDSQGLERESSGSMVLIGAGDKLTTFEANGKGGFVSPKGDENLMLEAEKEGETIKAYLLKDPTAGTTVKYVQPGGSTRWVIASSEGPLSKTTGKKETFEWETVGGVTRPKEALAPAPMGVTCSQGLKEPLELSKGCHALTFAYAEKTKENIGEAQTEWGEYKGRLKKIIFTAYNPAVGVEKMEDKTVAEYLYDKQGRLRAEWNPQISPALITTYGYDAEGHVTALTAPGQQPWAFTYGTIAGDTSTGRLLKVTQAQPRPGASEEEVKTKLKEQQVQEKDTEETPQLSGSPLVAARMAVSNGKWSNSPVVYGYQWEDCNASGEACTPIPGADNANYTPVEGDIGHKLVALVTATNGAGSVVASVASSEVHSQITEYPVEEAYFGIAAGADGNLWLTQEYWGSSGTISKVTPKGEVTAYKLSSPFCGPNYITPGPASENALWFTDVCGAVIGKITTSGSTTDYKVPSGATLRQITAGPDGNLWFAEETAGKIGKITTSGTITEYELPKGSDPYAIAPGPSKESALWFTDRGTGMIGKITTSGAITEYALPKGSAPAGIAAGGDGNLWFAEEGTSKIGKITTSGTISEYSVTGGIPYNVTAGPGGNLWFTAGTNKLDRVTTAGAITEYTLPAGSNPTGITAGPGSAVWFADMGTSKIGKLTPLTSEAEVQPAQPGTTIDYNVPLEGTGAPQQMGVNSETGRPEPEKWGQTDDPTEATAIFPPDEPMGWPAKDYTRATITYLDEFGHTVNVATPNGAISTTEYNATGDVSRALTPDNRAAALKEGSKSAEVSKLLDTENTYNKEGTELERTLGPQHTVKLSSGSQVLARGETQYFYDEGAPAEGGPYLLATKTTESALVSGKEEETRTSTTYYSGQENLGWQLGKPTSTTTDPSGLKLTHTIEYEASTGEVSETRMPASPSANSAHDTQTIYYTAAANSTYPGCGEHAEWAALPCQTQPSKQPETSGLPNLPVTTTTYNIWDEPVKTTETVGSTTRTKTATYEASGRLEKTTVSSTVGTALPTVTDEYNKETGALEKQSTTSEGKTKTITSVYNTLGELVSYTDADEATTTYEYDIDGRIKEINDGKGTETYAYNNTIGFLTELLNEYGTTKLAFAATYDTEGNLLTASYPNGMNAGYTYNATGEPTSLEYIKTTHCTEKCTLFSDTVVPSIHGQTLEQTSTLSHQAYTYDTAGRLTQVQNTPAGGKCTTRIYAYEEDTNRTSLTTREPNTKGECATEGGTVEKHSYDTADRLTDTGVKYSEFGNTTNLPASDAGDSALTSTFYTDNQLASQTQNGETIGYTLDPDERTLETVSTGKKTSDVTNHYAGPGSSPAWTVNTSSESTRNITGINGSLAAIQHNGETPVLQLTDLHGDIIATASTSETETKLLSTSEASEFGVPTTSTPAKYSWLGAEQQPTELPSGEIAMGARSHIPQLGRFLQPDPRPSGSANAYSYTFGDPVNTSDPSGEFTVATPTWSIELNDREAQQATEAAEAAIRKAAEEAAARAAAEAAARAAAAAAAAAGPAGPLGGSAGWACEYAAETG